MSLFSYVNVKIAELDGRKQELLARIAELTVEAISPEQVSQISRLPRYWENVSFDDKRRVVDLMITTIARLSHNLCKLPERCRIEASYRRISIWPEKNRTPEENARREENP